MRGRGKALYSGHFVSHGLYTRKVTQVCYPCQKRQRFQNESASALVTGWAVAAGQVRSVYQPTLHSGCCGILAVKCGNAVGQPTGLDLYFALNETGALCLRKVPFQTEPTLDDELPSCAQVA